MPRYDQLFRQIVRIIKEDYAGYEEVQHRHDPRPYVNQIGTAFMKHELTEDLFYRWINQYLAETQDRNLRFYRRPTPEAQPFTNGFYTRRLADRLIVSEVQEETRLQPGDEIIEINAHPLTFYTEVLKKNLFYADEPERQIWTGFLKMTDTKIGRAHV